MKTLFHYLTTPFILGLVALTPHFASACRIGTYDSRAIAVAYAGSPLHEASLQPMQTAYREAKARGDAAEMKRLEQEGQALQAKAHLQAFSAAPVDEILAQIATVLTTIQTDADVSALVSKWDAAALAAYPDCEQVDVTMALVDALQPTERQRKFALDIQKKAPLPADKVRAQHN